MGDTCELSLTLSVMVDEMGHSKWLTLNGIFPEGYRNRTILHHLRAVVRENRGFFLKMGKCDLTNFYKTLHIQSTLRINNFPEIIDFLAKRLPW